MHPGVVRVGAVAEQDHQDSAVAHENDGLGVTDADGTGHRLVVRHAVLQDDDMVLRVLAEWRLVQPMPAHIGNGAVVDVRDVATVLRHEHYEGDCLHVLVEVAGEHVLAVRQGRNLVLYLRGVDRVNDTLGQLLDGRRGALAVARRVGLRGRVTVERDDSSSQQGGDKHSGDKGSGTWDTHENTLLGLLFHDPHETGRS